MTLAEMRAKWSHNLEVFARYGLAEPERIARDVLADLSALDDSESSALYTPTEAAARVGYHPESICRLIRTGKVTNYGSKHRPRVKLAEIPRKVSAPRKPTPVAKLPDRAASSATSIARDAIAGRIGRG